ncbi:8730_t:CDS:10 [Ambispora leptoticha]|uniref:8730_t:CDS:1 n=1 Tax=Ambispora leptoticha TaxID=144679 RepID=A0A9N8V620_9GLOM|nr:8730_t:CDS:10 [Ambispora leptoticha]
MNFDDDDKKLHTLTINSEYARRYEERKRGEEFSKLKEKYGEISVRKIDSEDDDSELSSSEEEDEFGELVTPEIDAQIMKTITAIRAKDPKSQSKPLRIADYQRNVLLENGGIVDEDDDNDYRKKTSNEKRELTHVEEQEQLKNEFKAAFFAADDDAEKEEDFLVERSKTAEELEAEEEDYRKFLLENMKDEKHGILQQWQDLEKDSSQNPDEAFLMDYILNRGWIDKNDKNATRIPTYKELVEEHHDDEEEEDEFEEAVDRFESKYNFRFEEEGSSKIITHSRNIEGSVRRKDTKRKHQRQAREERKEEEKLKKREELKRLKNLKKKEIHEKLMQIKEITGNPNVGFDDVDLEEDFDPEKYDKRMNSVFNEDFYEQEDEDEKPEWDDDIDIDDIKDRKKQKFNEKPRLDDERKRKFDEYLDEYYQLDYEDIVAGIPVRFKYAQVKPTSFGLTPAEIFLSDDRDLNEYIPLKKLAPFRPASVVRKDLKKYSKKKRLQQFRKKLENLEREQPPPNSSWSIKTIKRKAEQDRLKSAEGNKKLKTDNSDEKSSKSDKKNLINGRKKRKPNKSRMTKKFS